MYRQSPVKGGRIPVGASVLKQIEKCIQADCKRFNVGRSFVISTVMAYHYNIREQKDFKTISRKRKVA